MTIKEVEKQTGLTAKSIRYYESKNLITVERNAENSYRSYSEKEVNRLKQIKLFRYLDFSIEEIGRLLDEKEGKVKEALREKAEIFSREKDLCADKQEMCLTLSKEYKETPEFIEEYNEIIEFLESDELAETIENLKDYATPNLSQTIVTTFVCVAPVLWLFYNINRGIYGVLPVNAVAAIIGTIMLTLNWTHYIIQYRHHKNRVKKNNRAWAWITPFMVVACIGGIAAVVGVIGLGEKIIAPENYLFYEYGPVASIVMIWLVMVPMILLCILLVAKLRKKTPEEMENMNDILYIWNHLGKWRPAVVVFWFVAMYLCLTSVNFVTEDKIICHSPLHPSGVVYDYWQIEEINTGFGNKSVALAEYKKKGSFFYQIRLDDKTITFHCPSVNEDIKRYQEESYLELEEFDQKLVSLAIPKKADETGYENCDFDKQFVERFLRIIRLK